MPDSVRPRGVAESAATDRDEIGIAGINHDNRPFELVQRSIGDDWQPTRVLLGERGQCARGALKRRAPRLELRRVQRSRKRPSARVLVSVIGVIFPLSGGTSGAGARAASRATHAQSASAPAMGRLRTCFQITPGLRHLDQVPLGGRREVEREQVLGHHASLLDYYHD